MMRKGREENPFPASQAAAHTRQPRFGVGAARCKLYSPIGGSNLPQNTGNGGEGGVWVGGGDLIQPVGGELAQWVTRNL